MAFAALLCHPQVLCLLFGYSYSIPFHWLKYSSFRLASLQRDGLHMTLIPRDSMRLSSSISDLSHIFYIANSEHQNPENRQRIFQSQK